MIQCKENQIKREFRSSPVAGTLAGIVAQQVLLTIFVVNIEIRIHQLSFVDSLKTYYVYRKNVCRYTFCNGLGEDENTVNNKTRIINIRLHCIVCVTNYASLLFTVKMML